MTHGEGRSENLDARTTPGAEVASGPPPIAARHHLRLRDARNGLPSVWRSGSPFPDVRGQGTRVPCPRAFERHPHMAALAGSGVSGCANQRASTRRTGASATASRTRLCRDRRLLGQPGGTWVDGHLLPIPAPSLDAMPTMTATSPDGFRGAVSIGRRVALRGCRGAVNSRCHGTRIIRAGQVPSLRRHYWRSVGST